MNPANSVRIVPRSWTRIGVAVDALGDGGPGGGPDEGELLPAGDPRDAGDERGDGALPPHATRTAVRRRATPRNGEAGRLMQSASRVCRGFGTVTGRPRSA